MTTAPIVYVMKGVINTPPYQDVTWKVYGAADLTGAHSGYSNLINIVVDYTIVNDIIQGPNAIPVNFAASGPASGDLGGDYPGPTVIAIQGIPISTTHPSDQYVLSYDGYINKWKPVNLTLTGAGTAGGDLSGTYPNPNVAKLRGNAVKSQIAGASEDGYALTWVNANNDLELTPIINVAGLHGATVPAAGSLTTGNVLQVNGPSSLTYAPVNLAGGANYVTGLLPNTSQQAQTLSGDASGSTGAVVVVQARGLKSNTTTVAMTGAAPVNGQGLVANSSTSASWTNIVLPSRTISSGTGLSGGGDLSANRTLAVVFGTTAGTVTEGNDSRFTATYASAALANQLITTGKVPMASSVHTSSGMTIDHTNSNITVLTAGVYRVYAGMNGAYSGSSVIVPNFAFFKNGSQVTSSPAGAAYSNAQFSFNNASTNNMLSFEMILTLAVNDIIDLRLVNSVSNFGIGSGILSMHRMGS